MDCLHQPLDLKPCLLKLGTEPEDDLYASQIDVELANQRSRNQYLFDLDRRKISLRDDPHLLQHLEQLAVTAQQVEERFSGYAFAPAHRRIPSRTSVVYAFAIAPSAAVTAASSLSGRRTSSTTYRSPRFPERSTPLPRSRSFVPG